MRYTKGSFVITTEGDIPLLRHVRNCRFVGHQQLLDLLENDAAVSGRRTFNWRVQRLLRTGHIRQVETISWEGSPVYSITQKGLCALESQGDFAVALHSRTRRMPDSAQVFHSLELNALRLALAHTGLLVSWQSEIEIASCNMVSSIYQKDYDAIVKIWLGTEIREFALEYERSLKSARQYEKVRAALEAERQVACVLYVTADVDLLLAVRYQLIPVSKRLGFAVVRALKEQFLAAEVTTDLTGSVVSLERFLEYAHPLYMQRE